MKLLLTSEGITNNSIKDAFLSLLSKDISETQIAFITTAVYFNRGDKKWFVDQIANVANLNPKVFELIELNSLPREEILRRLDQSDAVFLSGGDASSLMHAIDKKKVREAIVQVAKEKVYCSSSASSHIVSKDLRLSNNAKIEEYYEATGYSADSGLNLIDFFVRAHYKEKRFPHITEEYIDKLSEKLEADIYAIDDQSAVVVEDSQVYVVSEGEHKISKTKT